MSRSKCWVFTINGTHNFEKLNSVKNYKYLIAGREKAGKTGKKHLQCFVIYKTRTKFSTVKIQLPTAHIEIMRGSSQEAADYCKKDQDYFEDGEFEDHAGYAGANGSGGKQAAVNYEKIIAMAEDHNPKGIREENPGIYFRHYHTIKRIMQDNPPPIEDRQELDNEWIWGPTGVGKSRTARLENPGFYLKSHNKWWMGYKGEHTVIIDDLSKTQVWFGEFLKNWADHYGFQGEDKGTGGMIRPQKLVVTSQYCIEEIWKEDVALVEALNRRFKVRHITEPIDFSKLVQPAAEEYADHSMHSDEDTPEVSISTDDEEVDWHDEPSAEY